MPLIYSALDLLVSTSEDEAFGLALIEGLSCGCSCISSKNGGAMSIGGQFIKYVETRNIDEFFEEAKQLLSLDASEKERLGREAAEYVRHNFSIQEAASNYTSLYSSYDI